MLGILPLGILPTPPLIFTCGQKVWNLATVSDQAHRLWVSLVSKRIKISEIQLQIVTPRWLFYVNPRLIELAHLCILDPSPPKKNNENVSFIISNFVTDCLEKAGAVYETRTAENFEN